MDDSKLISKLSLFERFSIIVYFGGGKNMKNSIKIGLALGGGGSLGLAHIGAMQVLEENNIQVDLIAGTSMGAVIGLLYASGLTLEDIAKEAKKLKTLDLYTPNLKLNGLSNGNGLLRWLKKLTNNVQFKDLKMPFRCVAVDLEHGKEKVFKSGDASLAVRASMSVPSLFAPVKIGEREYVDGGVLNNIPDDVVKEMGADVVIAIDPISEFQTYGKVKGMIDPLVYSFFLLQNRYNVIKPRVADIMIKPSQIGLKQFTFSKKTTLQSIEAGRIAMTEALPKIKKLIREAKKKGQQEMEQLEPNEKELEI